MGAACAKVGVCAFLCIGLVNVSYGACPCSIWNNAPTPGITDCGDTGAVELGVTFQSDVAGTVSAVRFYKGSKNLGTHVGHLWSASGSPLASVTFANETASGWQQATFSPPVSILAKTPYVVSYFAPQGHYPDDTGYFASAVDNAPLHAFADGAGAMNGVYVYGSSGGFPTQSWNSSNYWVDLVFTPSGSGTPPLISAVSVAPGTTSATVTWTTDKASDSSVNYGTSPSSLNLTTTGASLVTAHSITLSGLTSGTTYYYRVTSADSSGNTATSPPLASPAASFVTVSAPPVISSVVAIPGNTMANVTWTTDKMANSRVDFGTTANALTMNVTDTNLVTSHNLTLQGLTNGTTYYYRVTAVDSSGNSTVYPGSASPPLSFLEGGTSLSIWSSGDVPGTPAEDPNAVELGVKFRSDVPGYVTGVRFYKGPGNIGVHTGHLWTSTGSPLATATFSNETASGWQQASFPSPVAILANTTYVISYFAPDGNYSTEDGYFSYQVNSGLLHALASGVDGPNGIYVYGGGFPNQSWQNSNYWVDVVFTAPGNADPSEITGRWVHHVDWPVVALNQILLHTGKVLMYEDSGVSATVYDPLSGSFQAVPNNVTDLWCSGHAALPDGRILVIGGHGSNFTTDIGTADANIFDPVTQKWTTAPKMSYRRWYPTATALPDGRVLALSGNDTSATSYVAVPEVYDPTSNTWTKLTAGNLSLPLYPHMFVLPNGNLVYAGDSEGASYPGPSPNPGDTRTFNVTTQTWQTVQSSQIEGDSVMYAPGKIMKAGSSSDSDFTGTSSRTTFVIDMNQPTPAWQQTASMSFLRTFHNLTILPDDTVLASGGETTKEGYILANAILQPELWSPLTQTWQTMATMQIPREYHSSAILLPDARVLVAGGGRDAGATDELNAEIYSPPYLFKGPRPTITSAPSLVAHGSTFFVATPDAASIASVALIRPAATTHAFNQEQRFLNLTFQQANGGLNVQAPANSNLAPPGFYLLFLLNGSGVPSMASFIQLPVN